VAARTEKEKAAASCRSPKTTLPENTLTDGADFVNGIQPTY